METLSVGMYVRTNDGYINKIKKVNQFNVLVYGRDLFREELNIPNNEITKASFNIIDILEVGDFLDNHCIIKIENDTCYLNDGWFINADDIENLVTSICTKEQFEQMSYKVGEENE